MTVLHALLYHTVAHMQHVGHFAGNYYVDIINKQFISQTNKFADVKISTFLEKNGGMRLWITKWTFNTWASQLLVRKIKGPCCGS